jgi:hypothetical protein
VQRRGRFVGVAEPVVDEAGFGRGHVIVQRDGDV